MATVLSWRGEDDPQRLDHAVIEIGERGMRGFGTSTTRRYALEWSLDVDDGWCTRRLEARAAGLGWSRSLDLRRDALGSWSADGSAEGDTGLPPPGIGDPEDLADAVDCDLGLCPVTNTMPIRRLGLLARAHPPTALAMAWVDVPSLRVIRDEQVYSSLGTGGPVVYASGDGTFRAELTVDDDGLVVDYPGIARRSRPPGPRSAGRCVRGRGLDVSATRGG